VLAVNRFAHPFGGAHAVVMVTYYAGTDADRALRALSRTTMRPSTRYAKGPGGHVAYQVVGEGPVDVVFAPDHSSNLEAMWDEPAMVRFFDRLSGHRPSDLLRSARDRRVGPRCRSARCRRSSSGWTTSERSSTPSGSSRVVLFGFGDGGPLSILFAATHPQRTAALVLVNTFARIVRAPTIRSGSRPSRPRSGFRG
jgi:pimeloyl-ACP methyl ester carboxylesterase